MKPPCSPSNDKRKPAEPNHPRLKHSTNGNLKIDQTKPNRTEPNRTEPKTTPKQKRSQRLKTVTRIAAKPNQCPLRPHLPRGHACRLSRPSPTQPNPTQTTYETHPQDFRKRLRKYAHLAASLERAKAYEAREHLHGICQAFARFLGEATEFYSSLLRRFEAMQHQYAKGGGGAGGGGRGGEATSGEQGG